MIRTQIQLSENQLRALKRAAEEADLSVAELVRQAVDHMLARRRATPPDEVRQRAKQVAGRFRSGRKDVSVAHDRHLADVFAE